MNENPAVLDNFEQLKDMMAVWPSENNPNI